MTRAQARVLVTNFGMHTVAPPATAVVRDGGLTELPRGSETVLVLTG